MMQKDRINILGCGVSTLNYSIALEKIRSWVENHESHYVCVTPVHSLMDAWRDPTLRKIQNSSGMTTPDGMPLVWLSKLKGYSWVERVYGPELMLKVCKISADRGYRNYFYGGDNGVAKDLADTLKIKFPGLIVAGTHSPPFRPLTEEEDRKDINKINQSNSDIVWVGLGSPKQEYWMAKQVNKINASVLIGVGAAFDFHTGRKPQAPGWMQKSGLEWFFRLSTEPGRLWKRYLFNNPLFIILILAQLLGIKKYRIK